MAKSDDKEFWRQYKTRWQWNKRHPFNPLPMPDNGKPFTARGPTKLKEPYRPMKPTKPCPYCEINLELVENHNCRASIQFYE